MVAMVFPPSAIVRCCVHDSACSPPLSQTAPIMPIHPSLVQRRKAMSCLVLDHAILYFVPKNSRGRGVKMKSRARTATQKTDFKKRRFQLHWGGGWITEEARS